MICARRRATPAPLREEAYPPRLTAAAFARLAQVYMQTRSRSKRQRGSSPSTVPGQAGPSTGPGKAPQRQATQPPARFEALFSTEMFEGLAVYLSLAEVRRACPPSPSEVSGGGFARADGYPRTTRSLASRVSISAHPRTCTARPDAAHAQVMYLRATCRALRDGARLPLPVWYAATGLTSSVCEGKAYVLTLLSKLPPARTVRACVGVCLGGPLVVLSPVFARERP
jgi:hypothetical protein